MQEIHIEESNPHFMLKHTFTSNFCQEVTLLFWQEIPNKYEDEKCMYGDVNFQDTN